jgi:hypothetical protein
MYAKATFWTLAFVFWLLAFRQQSQPLSSHLCSLSIRIRIESDFELRQVRARPNRRFSRKQHMMFRESSRRTVAVASRRELRRTFA